MGLSNRLSIQQQAKAALKNGSRIGGMHFGSDLVAKEMDHILKGMRGVSLGEAEQILGERIKSTIEGPAIAEFNEPSNRNYFGSVMLGITDVIIYTYSNRGYNRTGQT